MKAVLARLARLAPAALGSFLFVLAAWALRQEFQETPPREILQQLGTIPGDRLVGAIALALANYVVLSGYDWLAVRYVRKPLPARQTLAAGFASYAVSNSLGFALLSGSALRYHFYSRWGLSNGQIASVIVFCNLSFWVGLLAVGGTAFAIAPIAIPEVLSLPFATVAPLGALFLGMLAAYLAGAALSRRQSLRVGPWRIPCLSGGLVAKQLAVVAADWSLAAGSLYLLLPRELPLAYPQFVGVYLLAQVAGIFSSVPGGLGVFETVMLFVLSPPIASADLLGALVAFRGVYYFLPLAIAIAIAGGFTWRSRRRRSPPEG